MVIREIDNSPFWLKIDGKWVHVDESVMRAHPGGSAITTYRNKEATTIFQTFHGGSVTAGKWLAKLKEESRDKQPDIKDTEEILTGDDTINMGTFDISAEKADQIAKAFDKLRLDMRKEGYFQSDKMWYLRKVIEPIVMICVAVYLQLVHQQYILAALLMGLAWQQLGWMVHECCHQQVFKTPYYNDLLSYFTGNLLQGFSSSGWKEQHNIHHAATNVLGRDGDLDLLPFWATVVQDLKLCENWVLRMLPYQHIYWTVMLPLLRLSWLTNSITFVVGMPVNYYDVYRRKAAYEQPLLALHWSLVIYQLYLLPDYSTRITFFLISQLFAGWLLAHVVTYNHYSTVKFPYNARILSNYPCLQIYTTRNMQPSPFIDWLWGGLNYQIEHHLFPTMPRHSLPKVMPRLKDFCKEHDIPYLVDDYLTGWRLGVEQFANVARVAEQKVKSIF
ncbi:hypothetical protein PENTCL1PPCAC_18137 [Pristionchus entomophagus]|uniref:Fatty acid desaturase domain-containing protein n=1 Tax=Pristionchus entomophagus TaxID=358040 RepID=A0AAV5TNY5_9BILA|nr:hypothetical protein PENTCL1PPCAC_18137 [Pristionchus entomophagus]